MGSHFDGRFAFLVVISCGGEFLGSDSGRDTSVESGNPDAQLDGPATADPAGIFGPKLVLWLDADETSTVVLDPSVGNRVSRWKDRSPYGNDAVGRYVSPTTGKIALTPNVANGRGGLVFNGATDGAVNYDGVLVVGWNPKLAFASEGMLWAIVIAYTNPLDLEAQLIGAGSVAGIQLHANPTSTIQNETHIYGGVDLLTKNA